MSGQPDLVLQLAHHIRDDFRRRLGQPVEVRADAVVSLNGHRPAPLVDPNIDLATVEDGLGKAPWILPAPSDEPPHVHPPTRNVASREGEKRLESASTTARDYGSPYGRRERLHSL